MDFRRNPPPAVASEVWWSLRVSRLLICEIVFKWLRGRPQKSGEEDEEVEGENVEMEGGGEQFCFI